MMVNDLPGNDAEKAYLIAQLLEREKVAPKFEIWKDWNKPLEKQFMYKIAEGGRGAGAKSWSTASLLVQKYNFSKVPLQCICVREFMGSLAESSYSLLQKTIDRLGYTGWEYTREVIRNKRNGSYFIFRGLRDMRAAEQLKSYEGFDDVFADEAAAISLSSWTVLVPTLRKMTKQFWVLFNRDLDVDPCYDYFVLHKRPRTSYIHLEPGPIDNPWWNKTTLPADMEADYARDRDEAEHIWKGLPRLQGHKSIMSRVLIRQAMDRDIDDVEGGYQIGVDVARFGDDKTEMYLRKGMKVLRHKEMSKADTIDVANAIWDFAGEDASIPIYIDEGYNPGVADVLANIGALVYPINFGGAAQDSDKYGSAASEMWFEFPIEEADIPDDQELMNELSTRQYLYDKKNRKMVEPKEDFKKRFRKSPDKADALLLTFYHVDFMKGGMAGYDLADLGI